MHRSLSARIVGAALGLMILGPWAVVSRGQDVTLTLPEGDGGLRDTLKAASLILALDDEGPQTAQDFTAAARADYRRLLTGLYREGYFGGTVSIKLDGREAAAIPPLDAPSRIDAINIDVDPGPVFSFGNLAVSPLPPGTALPAGFAAGEPARARLVQDAAETGVKAWRSHGHAKAKVGSQDIIARHAERALDVRLALDPGPRLSFGPLIITGNQAVRTERIRAIAGLPEGETFDPEILKLVSNRLRRTGTFRSVSLVEADQYTPDLRLPIEVQIEERAPRRIGAGLEYSNTEGLNLSAYWLHRNLLGGAERFRVEGEISQITSSGDGIDYTLGTSFERPATFGPENTFKATAKVAYLDDPGYRLKVLDLEAGLSRIVDEDFTISAGVGFLWGEVEDDLGKRDYALLTLPVESSLDKRDDQMDPTRGYYLQARVVPFVGLSGSRGGMQAKGDFRAYRSFGTTRPVTLAGRLQLGTLIGPDATDAPADFLFFSGGGGTVRGRAYQSLGQTLPGGEKIGGRSFLGGSVEARVQVRDKIGVVGFYDVGVISDDPVPGRNGASHAGAGIGVRYDTRLGPIRLDVATPVGDDDAFSDVQFYIGIGQAF